MRLTLVALAAVLSGLGNISSAATELNVEDYLIYDPAEIEDQVFDYIVVGGGPTGLTAAARLSETPDISVLLIESGFWETDRDTGVHNLTHYGRNFGTALDHSFVTEAQALGNRVHVVNSGHGLGGSTLINGGAWTRPAKAQIDSWETVFGNEGWNWDALSPFMKKAETSRPPTARQRAAGMAFDESCHGKEGPVHVGALDTGDKFSPIMSTLMDTVAAMGVPVRQDVSCGNPRGVSMFPVTVTSSGHRCDAGRAWLLPAIQRPNLRVLVGQWVGKVLFDNTTATTTAHSPPRATAVEYGRYKHRPRTARATSEILLAAGAMITPLILEYSGIGLPEVLSAANIPLLTPLPVGLNLQDQAANDIRFTVHAAAHGQGGGVFFASLNETFPPALLPSIHTTLRNTTQLALWADAAVSQGGAASAPALLRQYQAAVRHWLDADVAFAELLFYSWDALGFSVWPLQPFSRGYTHVRSADPYARDAVYQPNLLRNGFDRRAQAAVAGLTRRVARAGSMAGLVDRETEPGVGVVAEEGEDDDKRWAHWIAATYRPNLHAVGTCSMMSRELDGVVDAKARVYGVSGLRVVDASILPTQIASHMMAVLYGVAEKVVADVLEDWEKSKKGRARAAGRDEL